MAPLYLGCVLFINLHGYENVLHETVNSLAKFDNVLTSFLDSSLKRVCVYKCSIAADVSIAEGAERFTWRKSLAGCTYNIAAGRHLRTIDTRRS